MKRFDGSTELLAIFGALLVSVSMLCLIPLAGTLAGAVVGWMVGLFFTETILSTLHRFGIDTQGLPVWELGATLGFVSGFFRSAASKGKNDE